MKILAYNFLQKGVYVCALSSLFVNAVLADASSDRLATYKANRLNLQ